MDSPRTEQLALKLQIADTQQFNRTVRSAAPVQRRQRDVECTYTSARWSELPSQHLGAELLMLDSAVTLQVEGREGDVLSPVSLDAAANGDQKRRGGYYTPPALAEVLARWAIVTEGSRVLEPSAGDGSFVVAARAVGKQSRITAVELFPNEAAKIRARSGLETTVITGDFFAWFARENRTASFDAVLGNPPFIRYQNFPEAQRAFAFEVMKDEGLHPSRLTNAWLPFVVAATRALRQGGRLALVLPAELLQVTYAAELRAYLARQYSHLTVVTFRELVFDGILQETVLLLGVRGPGAATISFVELGTIDDLTVAGIENAGQVELDLNHAREKWTQYYLSPTELQLVRTIEDSDEFGRLGTYADVDVGVVTGRNEFFVLSRDEATRRGLLDACIPLVGRSAQIPGLMLLRSDWEAMATANGRCYLLQLGDVDRRELAPEALSYVKSGERAGYHEGYKCRIRQPRWWNVPSTWRPDAFLLRQIYDGPRIIRNLADATSTDTIHRVRTSDGVDPGWLAATSMNSLTWAFAEIRGRSYGGGVLELEPTEAEGLPFPQPRWDYPSLEIMDAMVRREGAERALDEVDRHVLVDSGLSRCEVQTLRGIWHKLYQRRMRRKRR